MKKVLLVALVLLIAACAPQATVAPEATATSIPPTKTAVPTATPDLEKELRADVIAQIQADPNYQSSYVQALEEISGQSLSETCADFAFKLGALDENLADFTFGIDQYGICYAKHNDGSQIIFDKWGANGPLYVTRAAGFDLLSKLNPQATDGKTEEDFSLEENAANTFAVLKDDQGNLTEVGVGINGQWGTTGSIELVATPTAPSANSETDLEEENLLTSNPEVIASMASDVLSGKTEFPSDVNPEQYSALVKEMNAQRGPKPIYVEVVDAGGNPNVMYYDTQTRQMEILEGTYLDNKELIDKHGFNIYVEIGQNEHGLTTYIHPDTGEETIVENSGNIHWDWVGNKDNAGEEINKETLENGTIYSSLNRRDGSVLQVILINQNPVGLVFEQGKYFGYNCLDTILVRDGLGIRTLVGPKAIMELAEEGSSEAEKLGALKSTSAIKALKANATYYVFFEKNQAYSWEESMQSIDSLENVFDAKEMYSKVMEGLSADGVVILRSPIIVLRKNK